MIKQFFQMGGVTNQKDFYKKYPTEQHFFSAHPEAMAMVGGGFRNGGMYAYQIGGEHQSDYEVLSNQYPEQYYSQPEQYHVQPEQPFVGPIMPEYAKNMGTSNVGATEGYTGNSIADYFRSKGMDGSLASRKKMFGKGYTGSKDQNIEILKQLIASNGEEGDVQFTPTVVGKTNSVTGTTTKKSVPSQTPLKPGSYYMETDNNPYQEPSHNIYGYGNTKSIEVTPKLANVVSSLSDPAKVGITLASLTALAAAGKLTYQDLNVLADAAQSNINFKGTAKGKLTKAINQLKNQTLQKAGNTIQSEYTAFKSLPKRAQNIYSNFMDPAGLEDIYGVSTPSAKAHMATYNPSERLEGALTADEEVQKALQEAFEESKVWHKFRTAQGKTAAGILPKVVAPMKSKAPGMVENFGRFLGKNIAKFIPKEYGGSTDNGTYDAGTGSYYRNGGGLVKGGEYDMSDDDIQDLINKGYKIQYL